MMRSLPRHTPVILLWLVAAVYTLTAWSGAVQDYPFVFRDVSHEIGLYPAITGVRAHAGLLGDYNNDGWIDFYVGTFQTEASSSSVLFRNIGGKRFEVDTTQPQVLHPGRTTGGMFADLDNDGDLDLYICNNTADAGSGALATSNFLYRNDDGKYTDISLESRACPPYSTRNVVPFDLDGDGLLDFILGGGRYRNQGRPGGRILKNLSECKFQDVSAECGLPEGMGGFTCATADVNNDTFPDIFYVYRNGGLLLNDGAGKFTSAVAANQVFVTARAIPDQAQYGPCFVDVNRDGLLDLVIGQHSERPWLKPVGPRLFLNQGLRDGQPSFEDVTDQAGVTPLFMKCPHIEILDFDNDGWPDIYASTFKFADGKVYPVIYRNLGIRDGMVRFIEYASAVNDFPTPEDRGMRGSAELFNAKMNRERKITYAVAAPCGDYDRDGRIDIFAAEWWAENPSFLLHNETLAGHWMQVVVKDAPGINRMGLGAKVNIYTPGRLGDRSALIGCRDITIGYGFACSQEAMAHFGLGPLTECDIEVILPFRKGVLRRQHVTADQRVVLP